MKRVWPILKGCLTIWGAISLCGVALMLLVTFVRFRGPAAGEGIDYRASKDDVRYILNWCRLGDSRIAEVVHSHLSSRSFNGDHFDAHAIRISHVSLAELKPDDAGAGWYRCDQLKGVLADTLDFVGVWSNSDDIKWFPTKQQLQTSDYFVYPWSIYCRGTHPTSAELIFVRPSDRMVFFFGCKT